MFDCKEYVHVFDALHEKLDDKGEKCNFIGYSQEIKGYNTIHKLRKLLSIMMWFFMSKKYRIGLLKKKKKRTIKHSYKSRKAKQRSKYVTY